MKQPRNCSIQEEWRKLGFFYDIEDTAQSWFLKGSKSGLLNFATLIIEYACNPKNAILSEHEHFGPYKYLKIGTWKYPGITQDWIAGPVEDLKLLASNIQLLLTKAIIDDIIHLKPLFAPNSLYDCLLQVEVEGFNPASADKDLVTI